MGGNVGAAMRYWPVCEQELVRQCGATRRPEPSKPAQSQFAALNCNSRLQTLLTIRREAVRAGATAVALACRATQGGSGPIRLFFAPPPQLSPCPEDAPPSLLAPR